MTPTWSTSCPDWGDRLRNGKSIIPPPIFPEEAEAGLKVLRELHIVDAPGSPRIEEACGQWVFDLAASIFGAYDNQSGTRLITEWFVMLPKKNFKSGLAASIMLTSLIRNWRQSAEFTILAPTIEVAKNSFDPARDMVKHDEELDDLLHVQTHVKTITHLNTNAMLKVVAADSNSVSGKKSVGVLVEELWLFGKQANAKEMLREALGGLASRPEGFVIWLTTQSDDPPAGIFKEKLQYARDVRDGKIHDPQFLPIIYEHPMDLVQRDEHLLLENLWMVNPNLGYSVNEQFLNREYTKARNENEASLRGFLAKHGNVEIGLSLRSDRWAGVDFWQTAQDPQLKQLEYLIEQCEVIDVGIDGGGLDDLLGLAIVGRQKLTGKWLAWFHAWAHPSVLERRKQEAARFQDFEKDGDLTLVKNIGEDVSELAGYVAMVWHAGKLDRVGVDPHGLGGIIEAIEAEEVEPDKIIGISQGWKLTGAIKTAERKLAEGVVVHAGTPMMNWCVGNARVEPRGNAVIITKQASGNAKIDPLMAFFNAVSLLSLNPESMDGMDSFLADPVAA